MKFVFIIECRIEFNKSNNATQTMKNIHVVCPEAVIVVRHALATLKWLAANLSYKSYSLIRAMILANNLWKTSVRVERLRKTEMAAKRHNAS